MTAEEIVMRIRASTDTTETADLTLRLLKSLEGLTITLAKPFLRSGVLQSPELLSVAFLAASQALRTWDQERGGSFVGTYKYTLLSELTDAVQESSQVHIASHMRNRIRKYKRFRMSFMETHNREPNDTEICEGLRLSRQELDAIKVACEAQVADSLDRPVDFDGDGSGAEITLADTVPSSRNLADEVESKVFRAQLAECLRETLQGLPSDEVKVIRYRFGEGSTIAQTALEMGIRQSDVRRISGRALRHLRDRSSGLMGFLAEQSPTRHTGLNAFKTSGASQPEHMVLMYEDDDRPWRGKP